MNFNFDTKTGDPVHLDGGKEPSFYIDMDLEFIKSLEKLQKEMIELSKKEENKSENFAETYEKQYDLVHYGIAKLIGGEENLQKITKGRKSIDLLLKFADAIGRFAAEKRKSKMNKYLEDKKQGVL